MDKDKQALKYLSRFYTRIEDLLYYELSPLYDAVSWLVSLGQWDRWRKLSLPHVRGVRVLEVGFGTGILLAELARRGYAVFGLDLSPAMHRITSARIAKQDLRVNLVRGITQSMPLTGVSFDTVISTFPAVFILDPATIAEIARVLSPGGCFILVDMVLLTDNSILQRIARGLGILTVKELDWLEQTTGEFGLSVQPVIHPRKGLQTVVFIAIRK
ncbi:MAG: class I SAM-dependent methyltransferase [Chloroflexota bacterium]